jgi:hypothetical protein
MKTKDFDEYEKFGVERYLQDLIHLYADRVMEQAAGQAAIEDKKTAAKSNVTKVETRATKHKSPRKHFNAGKLKQKEILEMNLTTNK